MRNMFTGFGAIMIFLCLSYSANAQIRIGVKAGGNLYDNYQVGKKYFVSKPNAGFHVGAYGDYVVLPKLFARVEALFSTRGLYLAESVNGERINYERESSYVDFPISGNYNIWKNLHVHAGVVPSLFIDEYKSITKNNEGFRVEEGDQFRSYERWQFGALVGASYNLDLFGKNFELGARYSMAISRTNEIIRNVRASRDPKYMMLQAYVAYKVFEF